MSTSPARPVDGWQEAETVAAAWVRWLGHADARRTPPGADGGIDVLSATAVAQVKWKSRAVGRPDVQRLLGANAGATRTLFFFSRAGYTQQALTYAESVGIGCFVLAPHGGIGAANAAAAKHYGNAHRLHQQRGGWTDPAVTAAMQEMVIKWAGGLLVCLLFAVWVLWDINGPGGWLIAPAVVTLVVATGAAWLLSDDSAGPAETLQQAAETGRPTAKQRVDPQLGRSAPRDEGSSRPRQQVVSDASVPPTSKGVLHSDAEAMYSLARLSNLRIDELIANKRHAERTRGNSSTWRGVKSRDVRRPLPEGDFVWVNDSGNATAWLGRRCATSPLMGWVRAANDVWQYADLETWFVDLIDAQMRRLPDRGDGEVLVATAGTRDYLPDCQSAGSDKPCNAVAASSKAFTVVGEIDGVPYEVVVTGGVDNPILGSSRVAALVKQCNGETVLATPTGPAYKVDPQDSASVLCLLSTKTKVLRVSDEAPRLLP